MKTLTKISKLNEKLILSETDYGYDHYGSFIMNPFKGPAYIEYDGGPRRIEWLKRARNYKWVWENIGNGGEPYKFNSYKDALKVQQKVGGEIRPWRYVIGKTRYDDEHPTIEDMFQEFGVEEVFDEEGHLTEEAMEYYDDVAKEFFDGDIDELDKLCSEEDCFGESLKEAKVDYVKKDTYGKYGTEVTIYSCEGDENTKKGFTATVKGKTLNGATLDELEKKIVDTVNTEDKKADNTILNDSLKEDIEEDDLIELEEPIDEEPIDNIDEPTEPVTQEVADNAYLTQINDLITSEYGKIDEVKSIIATFDSEDAIKKNDEVISILNAFIDETTISIGMLTKATELIDSTTNDLMQQGIEKAEDAIKNVDKEEVVEESLKENYEVEGYFDIKYRGLANSKTFEDIDSAKEYIWELLQKGNYVLVNNNIKISPDDVEDFEDIKIETEE